MRNGTKAGTGHDHVQSDSICCTNVSSLIRFRMFQNFALVCAYLPYLISKNTVL